MMKLKKIAVKALSLAVAAVTALSFGLNAMAAGMPLDDVTGVNNTDSALSYVENVEKTYGSAEYTSNRWTILAVFFKNVDVTVELKGRTIHLKKTITNAEINDIYENILSRMPYQLAYDTGNKVMIDAIDLAYVEEPLTNKDVELAVAPADYMSESEGYRAKYADSELVSGVLDECLEQNLYSQILVFTPLGGVSPDIGGWGGSKYKGVNIAQIIMFDNEIGYYGTIVHEICHGLENDSKALNNNQTNPLHDMYLYGMGTWGMSELDWYDRYMNDTLPDGRKGVEPAAYRRSRSTYTPLTGNLTTSIPQNFSGKSGSGNNAVFSWDGVYGNGFQLGIFKDASHKELEDTFNIKANNTSHTLVDLEKGETYYFGVRAATTANGTTYYSDWVYLTYTHGGSVAAPAGLRITTADRHFTFSWDAVPNASGYQLAQLASNYQTYGQDIYDYNAGTTSVVLGPYTRYVTYYFGIRSYEMVAGQKVWSDWTYLEFEYEDDPILAGDINNDGVFNLKDVAAALTMCISQTVLDVRTRKAAGILGRALFKMSDVAGLLTKYLMS